MRGKKEGKKKATERNSCIHIRFKGAFNGGDGNILGGQFQRRKRNHGPP